MSARPAFVEACSPDITQPCPLMALTQLHRVAEVAALADATGHRMADALHRAGALLALDQRYAASARTGLGQLKSLAQLSRSLHLVATLLADPNEADWRGPAVGRALGALSDRLTDLDPKVVDLRQTVITEYLRFQFVLGLLESRERERLRHRAGALGQLLYDPGDTRQRVDPYFRRLMAFAEHPGPKAPAPLARQAAGAFWWLYNPVGKRLLDAFVPDVGTTLLWVVQARRQVATQAAAVRAAVGAALAARDGN